MPQKKADIKPKKQVNIVEPVIDPDLASGDAWDSERVVKEHLITPTSRHDSMLDNPPRKPMVETLKEITGQLGINEKFEAEWFDAGDCYILCKPIVKIQK